LLDEYNVDLLPHVMPTPMMRVRIFTGRVLGRFSLSLGWLMDRMDDGGVGGTAIALASWLVGLLLLGALINLVRLAIP
jgi:hypothetical protein